MVPRRDKKNFEAEIRELFFQADRLQRGLLFDILRDEGSALLDDTYLNGDGPLFSGDGVESVTEGFILTTVAGFCMGKWKRSRVCM